MVQIVPLVVFSLYMVVVMGIGIVAWRYTDENPHDFYLAGSTLGVMVLVMTLFASIASSFTFFGLGANASTTGFGTFTMLATEMIFYAFLFGTVGVKVYKIGRKFDHLTPTEYLAHRYESPLTSITYLILSTVFLFAFIATQIIGGAVALEVLIGLPYFSSAVFITLFMAVYLHLSGMRGVVWSDVFQGTIMYLAMAALFFWILWSVGPNELVSGVQAVNPALFTLPGVEDTWTTLAMITGAWVIFFGVMAYPAIFQRFLAANDSKTMRRSAMLLPILGMTIFFFAVAIGVWATGIIGVPESPDNIIPMMFTEMFPTVIAALGLSAGVAALMSTADSLILSLGSLYSRDVYARYLRPDTTEQEEVRVNQIIIFSIIMISFVIAVVRPGSIFDLVLLAYTGLAVAVPTLYGSLYWEKATSYGAVTSMVGGGVVGTASVYGYIPSEWLFTIDPGFAGVITSVGLFVVVSYITATPSTDTVNQYDLAD